jgi:hypothetical protein
MRQFELFGPLFPLPPPNRLLNSLQVLDTTRDSAEANLDSIGDARARLSKEYSAGLWGLWHTFLRLVMAVVVFFVAYAVIRFIPKPPPAYADPSSSALELAGGGGAAQPVPAAHRPHAPPSTPQPAWTMPSSVGGADGRPQQRVAAF